MRKPRERRREPIRYSADPAKTASALFRVVQLNGVSCITALCWILYRAEYLHINRYGRPVLGLDYGDEGGMPRCRQLTSLHLPGTCLKVDGDGLMVVGGVPAPQGLLSVSDREALDTAVDEFKGLDDAGRLSAMPAGWNDGPREWFGYENMLAGHPDVVIAEIASAAPYVVF